MNKNLSNLMLVILAVTMTFSLTGCGNNEKTKRTKTETKKEIIKFGVIEYSKFKIGNRDKRYFKMVDNGSTEVKLNNSHGIEIVADFEIVKTFKKKLGIGEEEQAFVSLIALDNNGRSLKLSSTSNGEMRSEDSSGKEFADFLRGEKGSKAKFIFTGQVSKKGTWDIDEEKTSEVAKKIKGFKVLTEGLNY